MCVHRGDHRTGNCRVCQPFRASLVGVEIAVGQDGLMRFVKGQIVTGSQRPDMPQLWDGDNS